MLRQIPGVEELCLTTNGTLLPQLAVSLRRAGVDRLNISLDTLRPERYRAITRTGELANVQRGIEAAQAAGFRDLKINCVLLGGVNDDEIEDFVRLTVDRPWQAVIDRVPELRPAGHSGVAALYRLPDGQGTVGLIEPMSCAFCAECSRIRITADGKLKPCLHSDAEIPLRGLTGAALEQALRSGIRGKPERHHMEQTGRTQTHRGMFAIGG